MALIKENNNVNLLKEFSDYSIYALVQDEICLFAIPNTINGKFSLYLDINNKPNYDLLGNGQISKEEIVNNISQDYKFIKDSNPSSIYVLPNFDIAKLNQILSNGISNNKQDIFNAISGIGADTKKIQSILASVGASIDTTINVVVKSDIDKKFAEFLESQKMGVGKDFQEMKSNSQSSSQLVAEQSINPFTTSTPIDNQNQEQINNQNQEQIVVTADTVIPTEASASENINNTSQSNDTPQSDDKQPEKDTPQEPTPIQNVPLNNPEKLSETQTLGTELESLKEIQNTQDTQEKPLSLVKTRARNGYVNIVIFMAILIGVTILSIQLGKFLYSVYG